MSIDDLKGNVPFDWKAVLAQKQTIDRILAIAKKARGVAVLQKAGDYYFVNADSLKEEAEKADGDSFLKGLCTLYQKASQLPSEPYDPKSDLVVAFTEDVAFVERLKSTKKDVTVKSMLIRRGSKTTRFNMDLTVASFFV